MLKDFFSTPIVRVSKAKESKVFFTLPQYEAWKEENNGGKGWTTKYYKGLGKSTSNEAKDYFSNLVRSIVKLLISVLFI